MQILAEVLLARLPKNAAKAPTIQANGRKTPYHTLIIDDRSITCALKPLVGLLRSLRGRIIEVSINPCGWLVIAAGTMKATLYDLEHPCVDDELQQARKAWQEAYNKQDFTYVVCPEFKIIHVQYGSYAPFVYDPPQRTDAERERMFEAFAEPPKVIISH